MPNRRLPAAAAFFAAALTAFAVLLWGLQVTSGAAYYAKSQRSIAQVETVPAARGKLLDRNGTILAQDQVTWSAVLAEDVEDQVVRRLKTLCQEEDVAWEGTGPIAGVTPRLLARVKEEGLAGVSFTPAVQRVGSGTLAPHVLGRVGQMSPEEWEVYQDRGYAMDETVGKDGAEGAFESYLHGTPGQKVLETDKDGRITGETNAVQPQAGRDVTLTLDRDLQAAAETALAGFLDRHPQATGGALVALDVRDGGVLAMVSQPGYDAASFSADYAALSQDEAHPLMNRAVQGLYAPGSTFKLVTAAAALEEGFLTPETQILDTGRYTYYKSPQPQCWLYRQEGKTHGLETVSEAIADSCNIFFYDAGRRVGIDMLGQYARALGLGEKTGIELAGEQAGVVAGPEYTASVGGTWYEGSVLSAAIGQENNRFTPPPAGPHGGHSGGGWGPVAGPPAPEGGRGGPPGKGTLGQGQPVPRQCGGHQGGDAGGDPVRLPGRGLPVPPGPGGGQDRVGPSGRGGDLQRGAGVLCPLRGPGDRPGRGGGAGRVRLLPGHRGRPGDPGVRAVTPNPRPWEQAG